MYISTITLMPASVLQEQNITLLSLNEKIFFTVFYLFLFLFFGKISEYQFETIY